MTISSTSGTIGFSNDRETKNADFTPGLVVIANATDYIYVQATANILANQVFGIDPGFVSNAATTGYTLDVPINYTGNVAVTSGHYFWAKKVTSPF